MDTKVKHEVLSKLSDRFIIVLTEPENSINIGSCLRAASNFGFEQIRIVNPANFDKRQIKMSACWGEYLLEHIEFYPDLSAALSDCQEVVGFSSSFGRKRPNHITLPEWVSDLNLSKKTALVFGPEDTGLTIDHMSHCKYLIRIPTTAVNPSINLAQSVLIVLYELSKFSHEEESNLLELPSWNEFYQLDRILSSVGETSGFFGSGTPAPVPDLLKNMFKRINPDSHEMSVLLAFLGKVDRTIKYLKKEKND